MGRDLFIDWAQLDRREGADIDVGLHRHFLDPTQPFAERVLQTADGVAITSATLADTTFAEKEQPQDEKAPSLITDWQSAKRLTGAKPSLPSCFDIPTSLTI